jgi:hypothetical protein
VVVVLPTRPDSILLDLLDRRSRPLRSELGNKIGCIVLFASLAAPSPAQEAPLGVVLQASLAHVRQSALSEGSTVYAGEELSTEVGGSLDLRIANSRFTLAASSRAHFYSGAKSPVADVGDGTLTFRSDGGADGFEIVASDVRIVPKGDGAVTGQVTIFSPCKITVTSVLGELEVTAGKETRTVAEKESYVVVPEMSVLAVRTYISPDDPGYHESHSHRACAVQDNSKKPGQFRKIAAGAALGIGAIILASKLGSGSHSTSNMESPDKP